MSRLVSYPDHRFGVNATKCVQPHTKLRSGGRLVDMLSAGTSTTRKTPGEIRGAGPDTFSQADRVARPVSVAWVRIGSRM